MATSLTVEQQQWLPRSISELRLSTRTINALELRGIYTVADLLHCTPTQLLAINNFGQKTLKDIYASLERAGFKRTGVPARPQTHKPLPDKPAFVPAEVSFPSPKKFQKAIYAQQQCDNGAG